MTANHEHTPTTEGIRRIYALKVPHDQRDQRNEEFWRWLAARDARIEAAAEQRGAERALREAADVLQVDIAISWNRHRGIMFMEDESDPGIAPEEWLKRRADRIADQEGDDA